MRTIYAFSVGSLWPFLTISMIEMWLSLGSDGSARSDKGSNKEWQRSKFCEANSEPKILGTATERALRSGRKRQEKDMLYLFRRLFTADTRFWQDERRRQNPGVKEIAVAGILRLLPIIF